LWGRCKPTHLSLVCPELLCVGHLEGHGQRADGVVVGAALEALQ
jgi:hypothetical protein